MNSPELRLDTGKKGVTGGLKSTTFGYYVYEEQ